MKIDLNELRNRSEYINEQQHPTLPLLIWNYSQKCQFAKAWDKYTSMCRGLITDLEGNIVARPFTKFFNLNETEETKTEHLPTEKPVITEKLDGSLGILYFDDKGDPCIATRGSFTSEQAVWATKWIQNQNPIYGWSTVDKNFTYLFEIIYKENRIVVDYDFEGLILLAIIDNTTGRDTMKYATWDSGNIWGHCEAVRKVKQLPDKQIEELAKENADNKEGYVVFYPSTGLRVKIKLPEYVRLHRLITGFSSYSIWECLKNSQNIDEILERVPDEFYQWVKDTRNKITYEWANLYQEAKEAYSDMLRCVGWGDTITRKDYAVWIKRNAEHPHLLFSLLDGKDISVKVWQLVKPKYELPFKNEIS